MFSLDNLLFSI